MQKLFRIILSLSLVSSLLLQSCGYKLTQGNIPAEMKTISVQFFENNAPLVVPYLSQQFTEALKDRIRTRSRLSVIRNEGDGSFSGRISDYSIRPVAIQGNERAGLNRLTITVLVKYTNNLKPEDNFEQSFTRYKDFSVAQNSLQAQEPGLITDVTQQLTEDIFNRAFANW
ncbi:MAG TPA: LptE family protein [Daejeonella sp.]|nr:LptE family protein [Daejeonella sp.]